MIKFKKLILSIFAICITCFCLNAQVITQSRALSEFNKIEASYDFNIKIIKGFTYSVEWTTDKELVDFWDMYVRKNVLYIDMSKDGKKFIRKNYKKDNKPCLNVTITLPLLNEIEIKDNVVILDGLEALVGKNFKLTAKDNSQILNLAMDLQQGKANLNLKDHSQVQLNIDAYEITANVEDNAKLILNQKVVKLTVNAEDRANLNINGPAKNTEINSKNSANIILVGNGDIFNCKAKGSSVISGEGFSVENANTELDGATCIINAFKNLDINIERGAVLVYNGKPNINIKKIEKSSVYLFSDYKK